jgi:hypothetical protein
MDGTTHDVLVVHLRPHNFFRKQRSYLVLSSTHTTTTHHTVIFVGNKKEICGFLSEETQSKHS